jgi:hypothetical protein
MVDLARAIAGAGTDGDGAGRRTAVKWKPTRTNGNGAKP